MSGRIGFEDEPLVERLGMVLLLLLLTVVMWIFGVVVDAGLDNVLHHSETPQAVSRIELRIVPLAVIAAARLRIAEDRLVALRASSAISFSVSPGHCSGPSGRKGTFESRACCLIAPLDTRISFTSNVQVDET